MGKLRRPGAFRPHPPRRRREPGHQDRSRAGARRARRGNDQPLVDAAERGRQRLGGGCNNGYSSAIKQTAPDVKALCRRRGRFLGDRSLRSPARGRLGGDSRGDGSRERRARRAAARADRRRDQLLHARRRAAPARNRARDLGRAGRDAAPRHRAAARGLATPFDVERAQTDASRARAAIPPLETLAAVSRHRIAVLIGDQAFNAATIVPSAASSTFLPRGPDNPRRCSNAGRTSSRSRRSSMRPTGAGSRPRPSISRGSLLNAIFGRQSVELNDLDLGAARFSHGLRADRHADLQRGRTRAINEIAEAGQPGAAALEDGIVRALEDVENALVALRDERQRAESCRARRLPPKPRSAARNRFTTAARSTCCRCSTRSARDWRCSSAQTTAIRSCCSTASSFTRRSAAAGKSSSPSRRNRHENHFAVACSPLSPLLLRLRAGQAARPKRCARFAPSSCATRSAREANRYVGTVQARHEVDQGFRVGGKVAQRKVDVGQSVREGDVIAVLDDVDYRLAEEAARQQLVASKAQARQAESDRKRLEALKVDGSVSAADEEQAQTRAQQTKAAAEADERKLELARNRLKYTVLRAPRSGVVTAVKRRGRAGRRRGPAGRIDRRPGRARDRGRRAGRSLRVVQEGAVQGMARNRAGRNLRSECCASSRCRRPRKRAPIAPA